MRWLLYPLAALLALAVIGLATLAVICLLAWPNLPSLETLTDYRPRIPMRVYTADGHLISEFGEERRTVVKIQDVPAHLRQALLAAEDQKFYEHSGVDITSFMRAFINNLRSNSRGQGGSTITMQVARNFFLSRERSYSRKLYEILLAVKIERNLSKDQILELYINQIFLGRRAYGFSAAAQIYFGKSLDKLTLAENAMLAGLPQAPSNANPVTNFTLAQQRQRYVLRRMLEAGFITEAQYQQALKEPLRITSGRSSLDTNLTKTSSTHAEYIAEIARQIAVEQYGEDVSYQSGLKIITTITRPEQEAAYKALRKGVMDYDHRRGYRGPEKTLPLQPGEPNKAELDKEIAQALDFGDLLAAVVLTVTPKEVTVYRNGQTLPIGSNGLRFVASSLSEKASQARRIRRGALVRIRKTDQEWELTQLPEVEAALLSIDSKTGAVRALVGGFDFSHRKFNNVTQAGRQPGSSFKPFIYSASLEKGYAPGTLIADEPLFYPAGSISSHEWTPRNYDDKFSGIITLRDALAHSKNIPAIRVLENITPAYAQRYVGRFGFDASHHPPYLTMALGAGSVTPWEMATAYAVFANGGYRVNPYIIKEVRDNNDKPIARTTPLEAGKNAKRVIDARNAWIMTSMLQDVVRRGTAARARSLNRNDLAGKTGTTNDFVDAWFCGYNPEIVAVSWIGFPIPRNLGRGETGGNAALPIWIDYMRTALAGKSESALPRPTGLASSKVHDGRREDFYYAENPPPAVYLPAQEEESTDWFSSLFGTPSRNVPSRNQQQREPVGDRLFLP